MDFNKIFGELNKKGIKYLVAGGVAVNLYGYVRATADLDIMILMSDDNVGRFIELIKALGYKPRVPVKLDDFLDKEKRKQWVAEKEMKVFSVYNPSNVMESIGVMIEDYVKFDEAYDRRRVINTMGVEVPLVSIDDLIKLKEHAGRGRDKIDLDALKEIKNGNEIK